MNLFATLLNRLPSLLLIVIAACFTIAGDYFAKSWSINSKQIYYLLAIISYMGSGLFYTPVLLKQGLVVSSLIWSILTIVGFMVVGFVIFKESLNMMQIIGACLGIISLIILSIA